MAHPRCFTTKAAARQYVWGRLQNDKLARFPFPPHGRIPNFAGAKEAAEILLAHPLVQNVKRIKANPDAPQRFVREGALRRGITVLMPTPRLSSGFQVLDPARIPAEHYREAASLSKCDRWAHDVPVRDLPPVDLIVCGSVAVTRTGRRCGKGEGYSDLEYGILRELGHPPVPVVTSVHDVQVLDDFPRDPNDLPLSLIVTPGEIIEIADPPPAPDGITWDLLGDDALDAMPVLRELRESLS